MNKQRLQKVLEQMEGDRLTQLLISDPSAIYYLTGQWVHPHERMLALYISVTGNHRLFINDLFTVQDDPDALLVRFSDVQDGVAVVAEHTDHSKPLGVDKDWPARFLLRLMELGGASAYQNASVCVDRVRACKDAQEQQLMRAASKLNDLCMEKVPGMLHEGVTEISVAQQIAALFTELGAEGMSFSPSVGFGANAAIGHHDPDETTLRAGDCVLIDMGCVKDGYCSDMTRTFFYKEASAAHKAVYDLVLAAHEAAEALVRPGVPLCELDHAARSVIAEAGYGAQFTHRLGHSIGFECHEWGDVSATNTDCAREGMIFSIEPGIYLQGDMGVRIENLVLVTADGFERLNSYPRAFAIVE